MSCCAALHCRCRPRSLAGKAVSKLSLGLRFRPRIPGTTTVPKTDSCATTLKIAPIFLARRVHLMPSSFGTRPRTATGTPSAR